MIFKPFSTSLILTQTLPLTKLPLINSGTEMTNRQLRKIGIGLMLFKIRIKRHEPHIPIGVEQKVIVEILQPDNSTLVFKFSDGSEEVKQHRTRDKYLQEFKRIQTILNKVDFS